jgi:hypothetical protein
MQTCSGQGKIEKGNAKHSALGLKVHEVFDEWKLFTTEATVLCRLENSTLIFMFWDNYSIVPMFPFPL